MKREDLKKVKLPDAPGVYQFTRRGRALYIGKAASLRDRVRSYFARDLGGTRGPLVVRMVADADRLLVTETDSVLEALILEANLIRRFQPRANTLGKDDKTYNYVAITNEDFPRVMLVRGHDIATKHDPDEFSKIFGPYPHAGQLREALRIVRKMFPFRGEKDPVRKVRTRSVLPEQLGLVPKFVTGGVGKREYAKTVRHVRLFFEGKKGALIRALTDDMRRYARRQEFEQANEVKRQLFALTHVRDVSLIKNVKYQISDTKSSYRIEAYDVAHTAGVDTVAVMAVVEDSEPAKGEYRKFNITLRETSGDTGALREVLSRRFRHEEWPLPKLVVVDGGVAQRNVALKVLEEFGYRMPVVAVTKDERHRPKRIIGLTAALRDLEAQILHANAEAHRFALAFHRLRREKKLLA